MTLSSGPVGGARRWMMWLATLACVGFLSQDSARAQALSVYSAQGDEIYAPLLKKFAEKYPGIRVTVIAGTAGEMLQRVKAEAGRPGADVLLGGPVQSYEAFTELFESYRSPEDAAAILTDPDGRWHAFSMFAQPLLVNTKLVPPAQMPTRVSDLLDPKWSKLGGIVIADPTQSGTGYTTIGGLANGLGWDVTSRIIRAARAVPGSNAMFNAVRDGEAAVGWINEDLGVRWEAQGLPVRMVYPADALTVQVDANGIVKGTTRLDAARKLIDFLGSRDAQLLVVNVVARRSARKDVPPPDTLKTFAGLKVFPAKEPNDVVSARFRKIRSGG